MTHSGTACSVPSRTSSAGRFTSTPSPTRLSASCRRCSSSRQRATPQLWTPLAFNPKDLHGRSRRARSLLVVGRVAAGRTTEQAHEELQGPGRAHRPGPPGQQRGLEREGDCGSRAARGRVAAGALRADGGGRVPAPDRLREHGQPAARPSVEPPPRDCRSQCARRRTLGFRAPDSRREPPSVDGGRCPRTAGGGRGPAPADRAPRGTAPAHGPDRARSRRLAVHHGHLCGRCARIRHAPGAARLPPRSSETSSASRPAIRSVLEPAAGSLGSWWSKSPSRWSCSSAPA